MAVASRRHHDTLRSLRPAGGLFDYKDADVAEQVLLAADEYHRRQTAVSGGSSPPSPRVPLILDCIGSAEGTLRPISRIAERGTKVAIMLPVGMVHSSEKQAPELEMDVLKVLPGEWRDEAKFLGTRTHFYDAAKRIPTRPSPTGNHQKGIIKLNQVRVIEGEKER